MKESIISGKTALGIELGSTRIKSVLIDEAHNTIATGEHTWENKFSDGIWFYNLEDAWTGLQDSFENLQEAVSSKFGVKLTKVGAIGISGMMHGYLVVDENGKQLSPFRTWRNTNAEKAADILTEEFNFNIPIRWSIAQLYQSVLEDMEHVKDIRFITTLAGYVHWKLTDCKVLGIDDASGMFPISSKTLGYNEKMLSQFDTLVAAKNYGWKLKEILPKVLVAGEPAGNLTAQGALLLDPTGTLKAGAPLCPPEGDVGTGMIATNSIAAHTGNVSAGTSSFAMIILDKDFTDVVREIDIVSTPDGKPSAMAHTNNCTTDLDAWVGLFDEVLRSFGVKAEKPQLYGTLYRKGLQADSNCGKLLAYNFMAGEPLAGTVTGSPLFVRAADCKFTLENFMRTMLFSALAPLRIGMDVLTERQVTVEKIKGHGGYFKTEEVGQRFMAAALGVPVEVMESAGEGGAWGIALLAAFMINKQQNQTLDDYLQNKVFSGMEGSVISPSKEDIQSFEIFYEAYKKGLAIEHKAEKIMESVSK